MKNTQLQTMGNSDFDKARNLNLVNSKNNWIAAANLYLNRTTRNQDIVECEYSIKEEQSFIPKVLFGAFLIAGIVFILWGFNSMKPVNHTEYVRVYDKQVYQSKQLPPSNGTPESLIVYDNHGTITYNY